MEREFLKHCRLNNLEGVDDCLSRGVDVNTTDTVRPYPVGVNSKSYFGGNTGLMFACHRGNPAIVARLVQVPGVDINCQAEFSTKISRG